MKKLFLIVFIFFIFNLLNGQSEYVKLDSVVVSTARFDIPFSKNSRTIKIITEKEIENSTANNLNELLQEVTGIDIRQRGVSGTQADIYIRGGNFQHTLLLIDGIKVEDPQTGHHTLNMILPLELIKRIEIIKGPASRVYGQNAFSGAINIVTKKQDNDMINISAEYGSFNHFIGGITVSKKVNKSSHIIHYSNDISDGYRENTDFKNSNYFLKSSFQTKIPISFIASLSERKFGANNFYTNNPNFNEYEETQTSLVGLSTKIKQKNWSIKPKLFWKRNQDMFLLKREDPSFSRNFNISNKLGGSINTNYQSKYGVTGIGVEIANTSLSSNNLGDQNRISIESFWEHRFSFANDRLDITPGFSFNYFSDFGNSFMPGIDIGYKVNNDIRIYGNFGKSYRVPSYTELYINIPNFLQGNSTLKPEEAYSQEVGIKYYKNIFRFDIALFSRKAKNLIDYIKETNLSSQYVAKNLRQITTNGFEINGTYQFKLFSYNQNISFGYTFLLDDYKDINVFASRYLIDTSIKHHFTAKINTKYNRFINQTICYRFIERPYNSYNLVDAKITATYKKIEIYGVFNNIFNTEYFEKTNIPMPKSNWMIGLKWNIAIILREVLSVG